MKKIYFTIDDKGYLNYSSEKASPNPDELSLDVENNHEAFKNPFIFKYDGEKLIKDDALQRRLIEEKEFFENKPTIEQEIADLWYAIMIGGIKNA